MNHKSIGAKQHLCIVVVVVVHLIRMLCTLSACFQTHAPLNMKQNRELHTITRVNRPVCAQRWHSEHPREHEHSMASRSSRQQHQQQKQHVAEITTSSTLTHRRVVLNSTRCHNMHVRGHALGFNMQYQVQAATAHLLALAMLHSM